MKLALLFVIGLIAGYFMPPELLIVPAGVFVVSLLVILASRFI